MKVENLKVGDKFSYKDEVYKVRSIELDERINEIIGGEEYNQWYYILCPKTNIILHKNIEVELI